MKKPLWKPSIKRLEESNLYDFYNFLVNKHDLDFKNNYQKLWNWSIREGSSFWPKLIEFLNIKTEGNRHLNINLEDKIYDQSFFLNMEVNYAENILLSLNDEPIIFRNELGVRQVLSKLELQEKVGKLSNYFRSIGIKKNDRIVAVAANTPNTVISFLAANSIGAIWSSCSPDFGVDAILDRFSQIEPVAIMFTNSYHYGGKFIDVSEKNTEVARRLKSVKYKFLMNYPEMDIVTNNFDIDLESVFSNQDINTQVIFEKSFFNDPIYILYSSGTTGKPKCIIHNTGGPLIQHMKEQQLHCDLKKNDKIFYFTTCGWMMWNWLITALSSNASILLYDGSPFFPEKDSLLKIAEEEKLDIFGVSAKYIDALRNFQISIKDNCELKNLKCILSTGSPLSSDCFKYVYESIKQDVHLASISGGTDIVSCFVAGNPNLPVYPGEIQVACLGVDVDIYDGKSNSTTNKGELVCKSSIPSMPIGFWNDSKKEKYISSYFSKFENIWSQGDFAQYTDNGGIIIYGRSDATLNPGGIRIGTAEIYRVVESFIEVNESVVVGQTWNDDVRIILFVTLNENFELNDSLVARIEKKIKEATSIRHVPSKIILVTDIPRTRSGKISELSVRDTINNIQIKNLEALANPECLSQYLNIEELKK